MNDGPLDTSAFGAMQPQGDAIVLTRRVWQHTFGEMLIETKSDGSVWIDGKPVADTLPSQRMDASARVPADENMEVSG